MVLYYSSGRRLKLPLSVANIVNVIMFFHWSKCLASRPGKVTAFCIRRYTVSFKSRRTSSSSSSTSRLYTTSEPTSRFSTTAASNDDPASVPCSDDTRKSTAATTGIISSVSVKHNLQQPEQQEEEEEDTIFALSTGLQTATATALAVIRITGPKAAAVLQQLTRRSALPEPRKATLRKLYDTQSNNNYNNDDNNNNSARAVLLDHALVLYFPGPHSFTGQDVVELHCHGSRAVVQGVLDALSSSASSSAQGARLAEPGEFTQRAWRNGKFDLLQVEALADLLSADTQKQRILALQQLDGQLSVVYDKWRQELIAGLAHAEAVIDFGDDEAVDDSDTFDMTHESQWNIWGGVVDKMQSLRLDMERQALQDARRGELLRQGLQIAIVGPPNAGKSSLFNLLARRDAAIVSPTAGTTRDVLEVSLNLGGVKCILQDTAGVRSQTDDLIEIEGMKRAFSAVGNADLVIALIDSSDPQVGVETLKSVLAETGERIQFHQIMLVLNKSDLNANTDVIKNAFQEQVEKIFEISCTTQDGVDAFLNDLTGRVVSRVATPSSDDSSGLEEGALITRARHRQHVQAAVEALERFHYLSQQGPMVVDMAAEELRLAASELGRITGAVDVEDVLDKLFADFCIGK